MTTVAILAGGLATRLRPITETIPKSLVPICDRPFVDYQLEMLADQGLGDIVMCTGYRGEMIEEHLRSGAGFRVRIRYSHDGEQLLGTGGALKRALDKLSDPFLVLYGDSFLVADYPAILRSFNKQKAKDGRLLGLMTVFKNEGRFDKSNVVFDNEHIVVYDKKASLPEMHHIDWGLGILCKAAFDGFISKEKFDLAELYSSLVQSRQLAGFEVSERFYEIGSPSGIQDFERYLSRRVQHGNP